MISAGDAAAGLVERVRARPWGLAVAGLASGEVAIELDEGADPFTEATLFQIGSVTKTMTGVLLADAVVRGEVGLETTAGDLLGDQAGHCSALTLKAIATQRSGLPRLPPNLEVGKVDKDDPYAAYTEPDLIEALRLVDEPQPGQYEYSNFGFSLLGLLLGRATGKRYAGLIVERLFSPLGMTGSRCLEPRPSDPVMPGYSGSQQVPWWRTNLPGAGGVGCGIRDLATYLAAHLEPESTPLAEAITLATEMHAEPPDPMGLGWGYQGGGWWHNGGTGGFRSFVAFHRPTGTAVALLANSQDAEVVDSAGFRVLTDMVKSRSG